MANKEFAFNFMAKRKIAAILSMVLVVVAIGTLAVKQLSFGLDFTGGTLIEVAYDEAVEINPIRLILDEAGYDDAVVQHFGRATDVLIRIPPKDGEDKAKLGDKVLKTLQAKDSSVEKRRIEFVGPQVGEELRDQSGIAMIVSLACMLVYVSLRFKFKFALGAVVALFHDVMIVLGCFSLFQLQFDLTVLAAVLAVIGYSLNDTIVVSDRIRENFRKIRKKSSEEIINISLNQTLSRTVVTSLTTLIVLFALLIFGGELIRAFSIALILGVVVGTYSSIFVASNVLLAMNISIEDFIEKEAEEVDDRP
ncbi:MAG: protein translocase subunit SecF [Pseudomonadales bacterium]|nr:protein translocase subunit SecF [Pseudomonadales bacterium]